MSWSAANCFIHNYSAEYLFKPLICMEGEQKLLKSKFLVLLVKLMIDSHCEYGTLRNGEKMKTLQESYLVLVMVFVPCVS